MDPVKSKGWTLITISNLRQEKAAMTVYLWLRQIDRSVVLTRSPEVISWRAAAAREGQRSVPQIEEDIMPDDGGFPDTVRRSSRKTKILTLSVQAETVSPPKGLTSSNLSAAEAKKAAEASAKTKAEEKKAARASEALAKTKKRKAARAAKLLHKKELRRRGKVANRPESGETPKRGQTRDEQRTEARVAKAKALLKKSPVGETSDRLKAREDLRSKKLKNNLLLKTAKVLDVGIPAFPDFGQEDTQNDSEGLGKVPSQGNGTSVFTPPVVPSLPVVLPDERVLWQMKQQTDFMEAMKVQVSQRDELIAVLQEERKAASNPNPAVGPPIRELETASPKTSGVPDAAVAMMYERVDRERLLSARREEENLSKINDINSC